MHVATTRAGLSYSQALAELSFGHAVRREGWYRSISLVGGIASWNITDAHARSCSMSGKNADKKFTPHETDLAATDWLVVDELDQQVPA